MNKAIKFDMKLQKCHSMKSIAILGGDKNSREKAHVSHETIWYQKAFRV